MNLKHKYLGKASKSKNKNKKNQFQSKRKLIYKNLKVIIAEI